MAVYAQLADGRVLEFPDGTDPSVVQATVKRVIASTPQPTPKKESSVLDPLKAGYGSMRSSAEKAKGELALLLGKAGLMDPTEAQEFQAKKEEAAKQFYTPTEEGWKQAPVTKTMELLGGSLPYTALPLAAAVLANPAGAIAATGAAGLASLTQFSGSNLGRQLEVIKKADPNAGLEQTSLGKAVAAAVPQAALDMISLKALPLVRNLFKSVGKDLTEAEAKKIVEQGVTRTAADYALTTGRVAGVEGLTETGQQFFERLQAGLSIADADARKEYVESFIGGAVLGGALSPAGRYFERAGERKRAEQVLKEAEVPKTQGEKLEEEGQAVAEQIVDTATPPVSVETIVDEQVKEKNKKIQKAAQTIIEQPAPIVTQPEVISEPRQDVTQPIDAGVGGRDEVPSGPERGVPAGELTTPAPVGVATDTEPVEGAVLREEARPDELKEPEVAAEEVPSGAVESLEDLLSQDRKIFAKFQNLLDRQDKIAEAKAKLSEAPRIRIPDESPPSFSGTYVERAKQTSDYAANRLKLLEAAEKQDAEEERLSKEYDKLDKEISTLRDKLFETRRKIKDIETEETPSVTTPTETKQVKEEKVTEPEPASESDTAELIYQYDDIAPRELTSAQKQLIAEDEDILGDIRNLVVVRNEMDDISSKLSNATGALKDRLSKRYDELKERSNASLEQINQQVAALSTKKIKAEPTDIKESWDYYDPDPNEAAFVEQNLQNKTLIQAADWLTRNGPDNAYKEIARKATVKLRQLQRLGVDFSLEIIKPGDMAYAPMRYARGVAASFYSGRPHARIEVQLNGTGFPGRVGTSYGVALHEILHAALHSGITLGKYKVTENTPLGKSTKDLRDVFNFVVDNFNRKAIAVKNGKAPLSSLNPIEQKIYGGGYNFLADPEEMLVWTLTHPEARSYLESIPYKNTNRSTWDAFVGAVRKFLGLPESADTALSEVLQISEELFQTNVKDMSSLAKQVGMSLAKTSPTPKPATPKSTAPRAPFKPAPTRADRSADELLESAGEKLKNPTPIWKRLFTKGGRQDIVKKLQNDRIYAKRIEDDMNLFGKAIYAGDDKNAFYTYIIRSSGVAQVKANENLKPIESEMHDLMDDYVRKSGLELPDALRRFDLYAQAEHDFERRVVKFILRGERLLREEFDPNVDKNNMSPADEYKDIMQRLPNAKSAKEAKDLRKQMDDLMFSKIDVDKDVAVANAKNFKKVPPEFLNVKSDNYEVSGKTYAEIQSIKKDLMAKDKNIAIYNDLMEVIQKKLQPATKDLNREANHWTRPVDNTAEFYGYKHYVPLKGRPDVSQKEDNDLELTGRKLAGEGQDIEIGFEGRQTDPDNAILQSLADAYRGAMRAGRKDFFDALANASAKNKLNPKGQDILTKRVETPKGVKLVPMVEVVKNVQFQDRRSLDDVKNIKGEANVFRYNKDGSIDVIKIRDPQLAEAIRRTYRTSNPFWDKLNKVTSLIAQGHTRYNPSFAPVNFVADVFTNAYTMGAELGPKKSLEMLWAVATDVGTNGLVYKTGKFAQLFNSGKVGEIRKLAAKDPFYNELLEYVEEGGKVSYIQGLANKGQLEELNQRLGPSKVLRTKAQIDTIFDIYTDAFELASRVAAYRVAKSQFRAEGLKEKDARVKAATYAKNLANFELIGEKGKELGALYMFGRQAMTGAVRAVDALSNAMSFDEKAFKDAAKAKGYSAAEIDKGLKTRKEQQKSARLTTMALLGAGAAAYMMAYLASDDDEQGRNRVETDDMSRWVRNLRIPIPGTDQFFQLRWGFGLGAFASMGAQVAGAFTSNTPLEDTFFNMISAAFESFAGLPVSKINMFDNFPAFLVDSIMPSVIRPVLEYAMNIDSLGREIYNNRTSRYGDAYTGGDNIPEMYKQAAAFLADITNGAIDWSPNTMYFFANNYFDAVSRYANYISGLTMTAAGSKDLSPKDIPIVESFLSGKSSVDSREFAKVEEKVKDMERKLKMFENNPEQYLRYLEAHPSHPALVDFYNAQINGSLKDLRTMANNIRRTQDFSPKDRNELLKEIKLSQDLTKRVLIDTFKELNVEPGMFRGSGD